MRHSPACERGGQIDRPCPTSAYRCPAHFFHAVSDRPTQGKSFMPRMILHRYVTATLVVVAAGVFQYALHRSLGEPFPLVVLPLAALAASWAAGLAAGLGATVACTLAY